MKKTGISSLIVAASLCSGLLTLGSSAFARGGGGGGGSGVLLDANLYYHSARTETKDVGGVSKTLSDGTTAIYDIKLGYLMSEGLYIGGIYTSRSDSALNLSGNSGSATGASVGYMAGTGIFVMGHYLVSGTYGTYSDGSGIQADFGYKAGMGSGWLLGAELSYRSMTYKKDSSNAALDSYKVTELFPMVSVGYLF
jgi:hypothetical protein